MVWLALLSAQIALLADGRLHLQHGPIDCLCRAWGEAGEVRAAYAQAAEMFRHFDRAGRETGRPLAPEEIVAIAGQYGVSFG